MPSKFKFTQANLKALSIGDGRVQTFYWDTDVKGFGIRLSSGGKKAFIYENKLLNRTIRLTIKIESLEDARKKAIELQKMFADGIDPRIANAEYQQQQDAKKQLKRVEKLKQSITVQEAWNDYIEYQKSKMSLEGKRKGEKWGERHFKDHIYATQAGGQSALKGKRLIKQGVLYPLLQYKLVEITPEIIQQWLVEEQKTRANSVRQAYSMFSVFWNWLKKHKTYQTIIDHQALSDERVKDFIPSKQTNEEDVLAPEYIADWFKAIRDISNPIISAYLQCLMITGARRNEMAELKWSDINYKTKTIRLKDKMDAKGRTIPLHPYMESLINPLEKKNEYVFWSDSESGHITEPRKAHNLALIKKDIPHLTLHGIRRTFCTYFSEIHDGVGRKIAGHTAGQDVHNKVYVKLSMEKLAHFLDIYVNDLLGQAGIKFEETDKLRLVA